MPALRLLRRIDPSPGLREYLEARDQLQEIQDKHGIIWNYIDDSRPREVEWTDEIVSRATLGFVIIDEQNVVHGFYSRLDRAVKAFDSAEVVLKVEVEIEDEEPEQPEPEPVGVPERVRIIRQVAEQAKQIPRSA